MSNFLYRLNYDMRYDMTILYCTQFLNFLIFWLRSAWIFFFFIVLKKEPKRHDSQREQKYWKRFCQKLFVQQGLEFEKNHKMANIKIETQTKNNFWFKVYKNWSLNWISIQLHVFLYLVILYCFPSLWTKMMT